MKEQLINRYPITKTLRFSLIPVGKTEDNFVAKKLLEEDKQRAADYKKVKQYIDSYHKHFIESVLCRVRLNDINNYSVLYYKNNKTDSDITSMKSYEEKMRKQIAKAFSSDKEYKRIFSEDIIKSILPDFLDSDEEINTVMSFKGFYTYFTSFNEVRKNIYTDKEQPSVVAYRCINENLPKFLDNIKSFIKIKKLLPDSVIEKFNNDFYNIFNKYINDIFNIDFFDFVLSQSGINVYNAMIGGYTCSDGTKIQGLNEYINLYNQKAAKQDKSLRLPLVKPLYKQILSDKESISYIPESFESDDDLLEAVNEYYNSHKLDFEEISDLFSDLSSFELSGIYIKSGASITNISNKIFGNWGMLRAAWNTRYETLNPISSKTNIEKYNDKRNKAYNKIKSFSISELQSSAADINFEETVKNISDWYSLSVKEAADKIKNNYNSAEDLLNNKYEGKNNKKLCNNKIAIELIKNLLDSVKELELLIKPLLGTGKEDNKDIVFYGKFVTLYDSIATIDRLYDKTRNYITKKPYSNDKIKLNFQNYNLLGGWDITKERDYKTVILRKDEFYYLAIMDKSHNDVFTNVPTASGENCYEKMECKLLPGPNKMLPKVCFAKANYDLFKPSEKINDIRNCESFKKGPNFNLDECHEFIDFFKESIKKYENWSVFDFKFTRTEDYKDISQFYNEVAEQGYLLNFRHISESYINDLVEKGYIYLFKIYNKDFSKYSSGKPNLHTMYLKMLFDKRNLADVVYKLNGSAEMFYREASIKDSDKIIHYANQPIKNKNPDNPKNTSVFKYDLIKDKRYTKHQFLLHIPITVNFKANGQGFLNYDVRKIVKEKADNYVIGIDRGERNLIYISVVNSKGKIVEQMSLNQIICDNGYKVDYHKLLDTKEKERDLARKSWSAIKNIKELKGGYISQVIHKICELVIKYDAIIAMEDLNFGFKRGRFSVEKQVYQKFENMLISKMNLIVDKNIEPESDGGLLRAYQLTNKFDGVNKGKQNGIIFYVPAWNTSKIDPVTGFVDLLRPKYTSVADSQKFFGTIDRICYNPDSDLFEFDIDYGKFPKCNSDFKKKWRVCTYADRIETFRNKDKNNEWDNRRIILTDKFKALFEKFGIDYTDNLKESIVSNASADFHRQLTKLFALTLQMRNSIAGSTQPEDDYLISPILNNSGVFYDSRVKYSDAVMPCDADSNGAYNIARKALWAIDVLKNTDDSALDKAKLAISNSDWLEYVQK